MTRDEAIEIDFRLSMACPTWEDEDPELIREASVTAIDSYIALGMLKVDEPESARTKAARALGSQFGSFLDALDIIEVLEKNGFKIVEAE